MPVRDVLVCDPRGDVEHNDATLSIDVVAIPQTAKLLLASCIPDIEFKLSEVGEKSEGAKKQRKFF